MEQKWPNPEEVWMVPTEIPPERLFVYSAKIKPEAGIALKSAFEFGIGLPKDLEATYNEHLIYTYELGEKGSYWEAGPSADFTEILYIFSTDSLEEAQKLMNNDPFYKAGIFFDDWCFEWSIHAPMWRKNAAKSAHAKMYRNVGALPKYPEGIEPTIIELKVEVVTPPKLIASFAKVNTEFMIKIQQDMQSGKPLPAFQIQHFYNRGGAGSQAPMGYEWAGGPSSDQRYDLTILSVNSIQMAQLLRENDALARHGIFYDCRYFEWCIHMPLRKASPTHKETLERLLRGAGVNL